MSKKNLPGTLAARLAFEKKRLKKLSFRLKAKLFLTVILPGFIILLALETARTFLRVSLRDAAARIQPPDTASDAAARVQSLDTASDAAATERIPFRPDTFRPEFIAPRPVKSEIVWQSRNCRKSAR